MIDIQQKNTLTKSWVVCLLAMVCCLLWGSAFPCMKIGYRLFSIPADSTGSQILFAGYRFTLAGITIFFRAAQAKKALGAISSRPSGN